MISGHPLRKKTNTGSNLQAVIWDFGGVIVRTEEQSWRRAWEQRLGLRPGELHDIVFPGPVGQAAAIGQATPNDVWEDIGLQFGLAASELGELRDDFWRGDRIDSNLVEFIRSLRPNYQIGMISNAWSDLRPALEDHWKIIDLFDDVMISAEVGVKKPQPEIYLQSLRNLSVSAGSAIFIDDFPENLRGAEAVGMHTFHFQEPELALSELRHALG
jgi:putative hydrolase of the HAD superfamily